MRHAVDAANDDWRLSALDPFAFEEDDATLFQRADMVEAGWRILDPVIDVWRALPTRNFPNYAAGSWGPKESDDLMERDGRHWRKIE